MRIASLAVVPFAMAVVVIMVGLLRVVPAGRTGPAELAGSIALGLEFLLAAGLLRLASLGSLSAAGIVGAIILLRKLLSFGIRFAVQALAPESEPGRVRA